MSNFVRLTKNPVTGRFEQAYWLDNHFGRHRYGVQFPDGVIYRQSDHQWEFLDPDLPAAPIMVPSAKERVDAVYQAWTNDGDLDGIEVLHERAMQKAYADGCAVCREKLAAMMLRRSIPTGHGDTFDDLLRELEATLANEPKCP